MTPKMRWKISTITALLLALLASSPVCRAASCTTQAALSARDLDALSAAGGSLTIAAAQQDYTTLKAALLPAVASDWENIRGAVEQSASLFKNGQIQLRNLYLLDASSLNAPADTQFFCSNASGSLTVTINMRALPPGRYAVVLAESLGSIYDGQLGFILAWDGSAWKLGGLSIRPGALEGHDGVWYWTHARSLGHSDDPWSAWYSYEAAHALLLPVDFLSSPNLEKLIQEQSQIRNAPIFPYSLPDGERTWQIDALQFDPTLLHADLGVVYESVGVTDPAAQRTEAIAVLSALLKAQPGLRENFYGLWAYSVRDGKRTPVMELPMAKIP
jgi:hypothetical protein